MNSGRRIAAAVLTAALSLGTIGLTAGPAEALKDTTWPALVTPTTPHPGVEDTTWPALRDTTWPSLRDTTWPSGS